MKKFNIRISHAEILSLIAKYSYTAGERMGDGDAKARHFVQGAIDPGHAELVQDRMDEAWLDVEHTLAAYMDPDVCPCGYTKEERWCGEDGKVRQESDLSNTGECRDYAVTVYFPDNTAPTVGRDTVQCVHRYMVAMCRAEWAALTGGDPGVHEAMAQRVLRRLRVVINTRTTATDSDGNVYFIY